MSSEVARTQARLDKLADGSVVLDRFGHAWQLGRIYWYRAYGDSSMVSSYDLAQQGPVRVVHSAPARAGLPVVGGPAL